LKKNSVQKVLFILLLHNSCIFFNTTLFSQTIDKIKFARSSQHFLFFQKGLQSDTIKKGISDVFYFVLPDTSKTDLFISVQNGRLKKNNNDSTLTFEFLPGLKYETMYIKSEISETLLHQKKSIEKKSLSFELITQINGTSELPSPSVKITVNSKKQQQVLLENNFYFQNNIK